MQTSARPALSHIGLCVSNLDRSLRFYCEALGFEPVHALSAGDEMQRLLELEGPVRITARMLRNGGTTVELLHFASPPAQGSGERQPMNRLGLAQLAFTVEDLDGAADLVRRLGGRVLDETRTKLAFPGLSVDVLSCTDPDGVRIELGRPRRLDQ